MIRRIVITSTAAIAAAAIGLAGAQDTPNDPAAKNEAQAPPTNAVATDSKPAAPEKPVIEKTGESTFRIGAVRLDQKTREIRFPAKVNMAEGLLEYLICLQQGKIHEALLITEISPIHLSLAFKLLRYPASKELFFTMEDGLMTGVLHQVPGEIKQGARIKIEVEWEADGKKRRVPVNDWIQHSVKTTAMMAGPWLYTGGDFYEGKFSAEITGDIAAMIVMPGAMINYPGSDNDDNIWLAYPKRVPPVGTPATVIITPHGSTIKPTSKP